MFKPFLSRLPNNAVAGLLLSLVLLLAAPSLQAETVKVPLKLNFPLLQQLLVSQVFKGNPAGIEVLNDPTGCSELFLSDPKVNEVDQHLKIDSHLQARLAVKMLDSCLPILSWEGRASIISDPLLNPENPRIINFQVIDSILINQQNEQLTSGALWEQAQKHLHPLFNRFQLDLSPAITDLNKFLPAFLPGHQATQLTNLLNSLHLADLRVVPQGIYSDLVFDITGRTNLERRETTLNEQEQQQWQEKWQSMDAMLTFTIKHYAAATELQELRTTLFDILLDARYRLQDALLQNQPEDPVRRWFIDSWAQLVPVLEQIAVNNPQQAPLGLVTLVAASDALQALDKLGPDFGLDISVDGLRRLARLVYDTPDIDPLKYDDAIDPELLRLFNFPFSNDEPRSHNTINFWPIDSAEAAVGRSLNNWVPKTEELGHYLPKVRALLLEKARKSTTTTSLTSKQRELFNKLVMTTAWQESCWRQFVVQNKKIVPLSSSTGDTGIMQVNEKVWRGFVDINKLRWDMEYNVHSGSNILLNYLQRYVIKNGEHKQRGGIDNLARATYSAYNGGPGQIMRYRNPQAAKAHKQIDIAFYKKYQQVKLGQELNVGKCLGATELGKPVTSTAKRLPTTRQSPAQPPARSTSLLTQIHDAGWIRKQAKNHFTLQLGVFSSTDAATAFIKDQKVSGHYATYRQLKKGQPLYTVIYGRYSRRPDAEQISQQFTATKPWIRPFSDIVKLIR
jgi:sporulation related protein/transglycosylase-like protein with SLT domain